LFLASSEELKQEKGIETLLEATQAGESAELETQIAGRGLDGYIQNLKRTYSDPRIEMAGIY